MSVRLFRLSVCLLILVIYLSSYLSVCLSLCLSSFLLCLPACQIYHTRSNLSASLSFLQTGFCILLYFFFLTSWLVFSHYFYLYIYTYIYKYFFLFPLENFSLASHSAEDESGRVGKCFESFFVLLLGKYNHLKTLEK